MTRVIALAVVFLITSCGLSTAGVWMIAGTPWALMLGSAWSLLIGVILMRGARNHD